MDVQVLPNTVPFQYLENEVYFSGRSYAVKMAFSTKTQQDRSAEPKLVFLMNNVYFKYFRRVIGEIR